MRDAAIKSEFDCAVVGGGLLGASIAWGLAKLGQRVVILDEGDTAIRASRGNFALVWVQSKGLGMPEYAAWTVKSSDAWTGFAGQLRDQTGLDVCFERPGGFHLCLSEAELEARSLQMKRLHNQPGSVDTQTVMMGRSEIVKMLPHIGPDVVGGSYCPIDGHVNSLRLFGALHTGLAQFGASYLPNHAVTDIRQEQGVFRLITPNTEIRAAKVILAAGNANMQLAPLVGLHSPMLPERGQIIVTERVQPFLKHPVVTVRQTDEGTVMIGDSREERTTPEGMTTPINAVMANRAARMFPILAKLNVVRTWAAIRVMTQDGFPIYDQSASHPGAYLTCCHSGVTLAANHALTIAPMIAAGALDETGLAAFSACRFKRTSDVSKVA
jgi:glycine/D-amino acid oxidase-like deaminating enzyme